MIFMVQVNRVYLIIIFFNRPQFLVDSNEIKKYIHNAKIMLIIGGNNSNFLFPPFLLTQSYHCYI